MGEIIRLQWHMMMGGRKKWLVLLFLLLPVALTGLTTWGGGLRDVKREIRRQEQRYQAATRPQETRPLPGYKRILPGEKPIILLGGKLVLTRQAVIYQGAPMGRRATLDARSPEGRYRVIRQQVWFIDEPNNGGYDIRYSSYSGAHHRPTPPPPWELICGIYLFALYSLAIALLLALLYGPSLLGSELDNKTLTYLFTRPLRRWQVIAGKYLALIVALVPPTAVSLLLSWLILSGAGGLPLLGAILASTTGALLTYIALFTLVGMLIPRRAMVTALIYAVIFELILSFVPALVRKLTVSYYLRSLALEIDPPGLPLEKMPREVAILLSWESWPISLGVLGAVVVVSLVLSSLLASRREYVITDQV